jgi:hypothetical protein
MKLADDAVEQAIEAILHEYAAGRAASASPV